MHGDSCTSRLGVILSMLVNDITIIYMYNHELYNRDVVNSSYVIICDLLQEKGPLGKCHVGFLVGLCVLSIMVQVSRKNIDQKLSYDHFYELR